MKFVDSRQGVASISAAPSMTENDSRHTMDGAAQRRTRRERLLGWLRSIDWSVWLLWIVLVIHYRATRGIFQGKGSGDGFLGFMYLPGLVLHHSFDLAKPAAEWITPLGREITGLVANPCPVGPVVFWLPFYLLGLLLHKLAAIPGIGFLLSLLIPSIDGKQPFTGRTEADLYMAGVGSLAAGMWGIRTLFVLLRRHVGLGGARFAIVGAVLASPLLWYLTTQPLYQHATAFFAVTLLVDAWDRYRDNLTLNRCVILGAWSGFAALQRPQEAIWMLPIALTLFSQFLVILRRGPRKALFPLFGKGVATVGSAALTFLPQVLLWIHYYGSFRAPQQSGHFLWSSPAIVESLFSMRTGIFPWVPAMYLAVAGMMVALRRWTGFTLPLVLTTLVELYVNSSAWDFHGSWSFGPRRYTDAIVMLALGLGALYAVLEQRGNRRPFPKLLWGMLALLIIQNFVLVEWVRTRRTKSSSGGAYSAATWIRWAKGPEWLARTLERTGYPFLQPASTVYALVYRTPLVSVENILGNFLNERDWRIRDFVLVPQFVVAERPAQIVEGLLPKDQPASLGNVARQVRVVVPLVMSEPLRLVVEGDFRGQDSAVVVRWNGRRLLAEPNPQKRLSFLLARSEVKSRPRWNELLLEDLPEGTQLQRIAVQSTSRWWK